MRRYLTLAAAITTTFLALFAAVAWLGVPLLEDPRPLLDSVGGTAAVVGVGLLVADVALPVASSLVMVAHGAVFGVVVGALLSLVGSVGAALLGFGIGRRGGPLLRRLVPAAERERADVLLDRWGVLAIVATRPVPILAETVAILAGASRMRWSQAAVAAVAGSFPAAVLYALAGDVAASFGNAVTVFAVVVAVAAAFWLAGRRVHRASLAARVESPSEAS